MARVFLDLAAELEDAEVRFRLRHPLFVPARFEELWPVVAGIVHIEPHAPAFVSPLAGLAGGVDDALTHVARCEPSLGRLVVEDEGLPVVDVRDSGRGLGGENHERIHRAGTRPAAFPDCREREHLKPLWTEPVRLLPSVFRAPLEPAVHRDDAPSLPESRPEGGLFEHRFAPGVDKPLGTRLVSGPRGDFSPSKVREHALIPLVSDRHEVLPRGAVVVGGEVDLRVFPDAVLRDQCLELDALGDSSAHFVSSVGWHCRQPAVIRPFPTGVPPHRLSSTLRDQRSLRCATDPAVMDIDPKWPEWVLRQEFACVFVRAPSPAAVVELAAKRLGHMGGWKVGPGVDQRVFRWEE